MQKSVKTEKGISIQQVFTAMDKIYPDGNRRHFTELNGKLTKIGSRRLNVFKRNGIQCVRCGIKGSFFILEKVWEKSYFSPALYAVGPNGPILMTRDHIVPLSRGGTDAYSNQQTMCRKCNCSKGNKLEHELGSC